MFPHSHPLRSTEQTCMHNIKFRTFQESSPNKACIRGLTHYCYEFMKTGFRTDLSNVITFVSACLLNE